jgi:mannose-1-phosphate guanylyltransferase
MVSLPKGKLAVIDGLKDYIIVDKEDVLLIVPKAKEQDIKEIVAAAKATFGEQYG